MQEFPLISCIMPTFGRPAYVGEAVAMFLAQDYPAKELIILNDCPDQFFSSDLPGVSVTNVSNRYPTLGEKRNAAIELARGDLIAVWDDDDVHLPWRLSHSITEMRRWRTPFYRPAEFWAYWGDLNLHDNQCVESWVSHGLVLFEKQLWEQVGGYPAQGLGEDAGFFKKLHEALSADYIKFPVRREDRFYIMRGKSNYVHMSINGGEKPLDTSPLSMEITPVPIQDAVLSEACRRIIAARDPSAIPSPPNPDGATRNPRILIGVCSCHMYPEKRQAIRETWLSRKSDGVISRFFVGRGETALPEEDTIEVEAGDSYDELPAKVLAFFRHALINFEFDWLFKCDDDTYVVPERLKEIIEPGISFVGDESLAQRGAPSGGAGYLLARHIVEKLVADQTLELRGAEDIIVGEAAIRHGAIPKSTALLNLQPAPFPTSDNSMVSAHWCSPDQMRSIHVVYSTQHIRRYYATHLHWTDEIRVHPGDILFRVTSGCMGKWYVQPSGNLILKWFNWPAEMAILTREGHFSGPRIDLRPCSPEIPPTLLFGSVGEEQSAVLTWLGGPHDVATIYYDADDGHFLAKALPKRTDYFDRRRAGKFQNLIWWLDKNPDILSKYEWFLVCDDDIELRSEEVIALVLEAKRLDLPVSSPSHDPQGKISWNHMRHVEGKDATLCNFVEMTCVLFQRKALIRFLEIFRPAAPFLTGWGTDLLISKACYEPQKPFGVIHSVKVLNPKRSPGYGIERLQTTKDRHQAWIEVSRRLNLEWSDTPKEVKRADPTPKVVCINLDRATQRRSQIKENWEPVFGSNLEFFRAVDRRSLDQGLLQVPPKEINSLACGRRLSSGETACLMSHLGVMGDALPKIGEEGIIIMEDDIVPSDVATSVFEIIRQARRESPYVDMILLCKPVNDFSKARSSELLFVPTDEPFPYGTTMVWYGPRAIADFLEEMRDFDKPADHRHTFCCAGRVGVLKSPVAFHQGTDTFVGNEFRGNASQRNFIP